MSLLTEVEIAQAQKVFDTDLWWETEAAGSSLDGCRTNAMATEEPRRVVTMNVKDMVHELDCQSMDQLLASQTRGGQRLWLVLCVWLDEGIGVTRRWCCWYTTLGVVCQGLGTWVFIILYTSFGLEILNIVVLSLVKECKEDGPAESTQFPPFYAPYAAEVR